MSVSSGGDAHIDHGDSSIHKEVDSPWHIGRAGSDVSDCQKSMRIDGT